MIIIEIYITILPIVIAGIVSTTVVKSALFKQLRRPIDNGRTLRDGRRLFGDNKTWAGVVSLVTFTLLFSLIWGLINQGNDYLEAHNLLYRTYENTPLSTALFGLLMGAAYLAAELPNSYIKRRQAIEPGMIKSGWSGVPNMLLDHFDSVIGCGLIVAVAAPLSVIELVLLILVGGLTHVLANVLLVVIGVKKNI